MSNRNQMINYIDDIVNLYNFTGKQPFYTHDVKHIFPVKLIAGLSNKNYIVTTGESTIIRRHTSKAKRNQWKFTQDGIAFIKKHKSIDLKTG